MSLKARLNNPDLLIGASLIDGHWVEGASGASFDVENPATGEVIAQIADVGEAGALEAVASSTEAFETWKKTTAKTGVRKSRLQVKKRARFMAAYYTEKTGGKALSTVPARSTFPPFFPRLVLRRGGCEKK